MAHARGCLGQQSSHCLHDEGQHMTAAVAGVLATHPGDSDPVSSPQPIPALAIMGSGEEIR